MTRRGRPEAPVSATVIHGDCLDALRAMPDASVDAIVTDPPAGIAFMGKEWDKDKGGRDAWVAWMTEIARECIRVIKPGGHALVWAIPRTSHWTGWAWESAGWECRDKIVHLFGTGFPKSLDVSKAIDAAAGAERPVIGTRKLTGTARIIGGQGSATAGRSEAMYETHQTRDVLELTAPATPEAAQWAGWGTALKPSAEDWWLLRRPLDGTVAQNVLAHGVGGINVDGCRIGADGGTRKGSFPRGGSRGTYGDGINGACEIVALSAGRWPANVCLDETAAGLLDAMTGELRPVEHPALRAGIGFGSSAVGTAGDRVVLDSGGASRFYYTAKASREEREAGLTHLPRRVQDETRDPDAPGANNPRNRGGSDRANHHPTVKPLDLMRWLCRLITPPRGVVLDPFAGSGSTGCAAVLEGFSFIGCEREADFVEIARARIAHWTPRQTSLLDMLEGA